MLLVVSLLLCILLGKININYHQARGYGCAYANNAKKSTLLNLALSYESIKRCCLFKLCFIPNFGQRFDDLLGRCTVGFHG